MDETLTIDVTDMEKKIGPYTPRCHSRAHAGISLQHGPLMEVAKAHGIQVLEDACQANGATWQGKRVGTFGDAGAFSFNFYKILSAGEGGCLITDNDDLYQKALIYHDASAVAFSAINWIKYNNRCSAVPNIVPMNSVQPFCAKQLKRLDPLVDDLRKGVEYVEDATKDVLTFILATTKAEERQTSWPFVLILNNKLRHLRLVMEYLARYPSTHGQTRLHQLAADFGAPGCIASAMNPFEMEQNRGET